LVSTSPSTATTRTTSCGPASLTCAQGPDPELI
jgi:hypothetical protein